MIYHRQRGFFQFQEDLFDRNGHGRAKIRHEVLMFLEFLQKKHKEKNRKNFDLFYYTIIKKLSNEG